MIYVTILLRKVNNRMKNILQKSMVKNRDEFVEKIQE